MFPSVPGFFFFNDTATTEIYTLSLHDALPISDPRGRRSRRDAAALGAARPVRRNWGQVRLRDGPVRGDRKSTRLNSSHQIISYAVFCLKKKKINNCLAITSCDATCSTVSTLST